MYVGDGVMFRPILSFFHKVHHILLGHGGFTYTTEVDEKGRVLKYHESSLFESERSYDEHGNVIHYINNDRFEYWQEFDTKGNLIHYKNNNGYEFWKRYFPNENLVQTFDSVLNESWRNLDIFEIKRFFN